MDGLTHTKQLLNFILHSIYRGSYLSAHVLLNLLKELGKKYKMRCLTSILSLFHKELKKININTEHKCQNLFIIIMTLNLL